MALRSTDSFKDKGFSIGVNSLGFGGTMAVKNLEELAFIKELGPIKLLENVSILVDMAPDEKL